METRLGARQRRRPPTVHRGSTHAPRLQRPVASEDEASACSELHLGCHPETPVIEPCPALLSLRGVFGVFRIHQQRKVDFQLVEPSDSAAAATRNGRLPRWLYRLGARDHVVEWIKPKKAPKWMTTSQYATLPERQVVHEAALPRGTARVSG